MWRKRRRIEHWGGCCCAAVGLSVTTQRYVRTLAPFLCRASVWASEAAGCTTAGAGSGTAAAQSGCGPAVAASRGLPATLFDRVAFSRAGEPPVFVLWASGVLAWPPWPARFAQCDRPVWGQVTGAVVVAYIRMPDTAARAHLSKNTPPPPARIGYNRDAQTVGRWHHGQKQAGTARRK